MTNILSGLLPSIGSRGLTGAGYFHNSPSFPHSCVQRAILTIRLVSPRRAKTPISFALQNVTCTSMFPSRRKTLPNSYFPYLFPASLRFLYTSSFFLSSSTKGPENQPNGTVKKNTGKSGGFPLLRELYLTYKASKPGTKYPPEPSPNKKPAPSAEELAKRAKRQEELWNTLVPERSMGLRSPIFWILLVLVLCLHFYNNWRDKQRNEQISEEQLREIERKKNADMIRRTRMTSTSASLKVDAEAEDSNSVSELENSKPFVLITNKSEEFGEAFSTSERGERVNEQNDSI